MKFDYLIKEEISITKYLEAFHLGKSKIYKLFLNKELYVNKEACTERTVLHKNDTLSLIIDEEIDFEPLHKAIDVLYEDEYLLIVNKPCKTIIYDEKDKPIGLANMVAGYYQECGISLNIRFPHRLDTDTTGIMVFCKDPLTHAYFNYFMANHEIKREYRALAYGHFNKMKDTLRYSITRDRHINGKMIAGVGKDVAITHYEVLEEKNKVSLVKVLLETGKTHQIRCHLAHIGHPLLGDKLYGSKVNCSRVMLHSYQLEFIHPVSKEKMVLVCNIPLDMETLYDNRKIH